MRTRRHGVRLITRQIAPGMVQQMQQQCPACDGKGTTIKAKDRCTDCSGKKTKSEKKVGVSNTATPSAHNRLALQTFLLRPTPPEVQNP